MVVTSCSGTYVNCRSFSIIDRQWHFSADAFATAAAVAAFIIGVFVMLT